METNQLNEQNIKAGNDQCDICIKMVGLFYTDPKMKKTRVLQLMNEQNMGDLNKELLATKEIKDRFLLNMNSHWKYYINLKKVYRRSHIIWLYAYEYPRKGKKNLGPEHQLIEARQRKVFGSEC